MQKGCQEKVLKANLSLSSRHVLAEHFILKKNQGSSERGGMDPLILLFIYRKMQTRMKRCQQTWSGDIEFNMKSILIEIEIIVVITEHFMFLLMFWKFYSHLDYLATRLPRAVSHMIFIFVWILFSLVFAQVFHEKF